MTYQLPAVISVGTTQGVTLVISPLISLIQDQIQHLQEKGIPCAWLSGTMDSSMRSWVFQELKRPDPILKLLYLTPEMINKSGQVQKALQDLYRRKRLARFVVDEAHCLSQWGHDFRPDYKEMGALRNTFKDTPIMALTATANDKVKLDIKVNLKMNSCLEFAMSFNRPNLIYEIRPKIKNFETEMVEMIKANWRGKSGIIYCTSKRACEQVSDTFRNKYGLACHYYHAGMEKEDRIKIQQRWQANQIQIIVATVAFGMGIDKPDVRFVIHHSLPHSLEGYYQETGRAGRDGDISHCIMYYSYRDKNTIEFLIDRGDGPHEQKERQKENLRQMILFCENTADCRRQQVLAYFGERFNPSLCNKTCDVCKQGLARTPKLDVTEDAKNAIRLVESIEQENVTLSYCVDVFRGSKIAKIMQNGHDQLAWHGVGKHLLRADAERLFRTMVLSKLLKEICQENSSGFVSSYVRLGSGAMRALHATDFKLVIHLNEKRSAASSGKEKRRAAHETVDEIIEEASPPPPKRTKASISVSATARQPPVVPQQQANISAYQFDDNLIDDGFDDVDNAVYDDYDPELTQDIYQNLDEPTPVSIIPDVQQRVCFDRLRRERNRLAGEKGLPPTSIFTDSILLEMSKVFPATIEEMIRWCHADSVKAQVYGSKMLEIMQQIQQEASRPVLPPAPVAASGPPKITTARDMVGISSVAASKSIPEVSKSKYFGASASASTSKTSSGPTTSAAKKSTATKKPAQTQSNSIGIRMAPQRKF